MRIVMAYGFTAATLLAACGGDFADPAGEALAAHELARDTRARVAAQLQSLQLDPDNADACDQRGLLASVAGVGGRYFAFCGDGTVIQASVMAAEPVVPAGTAGPGAVDPLALYLEVAPSDAPVPRALLMATGQALPTAREVSDAPVVVSARDHDRPAPLHAPSGTCQSIASYCDTIEEWANDPVGGDVSWGDHWCRTSPVTWSQRTASSQLRSAGIFPRGNQYVRACAGESVRFEGHHRNPCTGNWDESFQWNTGSGGFLHMVLGQRYHGSCNAYDTDLRFVTSGGRHVYTGAFKTGAIL
jgi:hypothetical protein